MKHILLSKEEVAIVDDCYYDELMKHTWYCSDKNYAVRNVYDNGLHTKISMHIEIVKLRGEIIPIDFLIDHKNQNTFDNRSENLRIATKAINKLNSKLQHNNTSGIAGISFCETMNKWKVRVNSHGKRYSLGYFTNLEEATKRKEDFVKRFRRDI